jgi:hypothetical protein
MAAKSQTFEVLFPTAGLVRRFGYQSQPPYTCVAANNVRPYDTFDGRERGGSRPALAFYSGQQLDADPAPPQALFSATILGTGSDTGEVSFSLLAISNGILYYTDSGGVIGNVGSLGDTLNSTAPMLDLCQLATNVYIADWKPARPSGTGTVTNSTGKLDLGETQTINTSLDRVCITDPAYNGRALDILAGTYTISASEVVSGKTLLTIDWPTNPYTTGTVAVSEGVVTITGGTWPSWASAGILTIGGQAYTVDTRDSDTQLTLLGCDDLTISSGTAFSLGLPPTISCTWELVWPVKVYDVTVRAVSHLTATYGIVPPNCPLCCIYRNRLVLAGPDHVFYQSRALDPADWDYGADPDDAARPVGGTTFSSGEIGGPLVALIPFSDDYLIFACHSALYALRGDIASGGQIDVLSREVGIVGPNAWCMLPDASVLLLSRGGLYLIPSGVSSYPQRFSQDKLPADLLDVDGVTNAVSLLYDPEFSGVHIHITPYDGSTGEHWWLDLTKPGFWPVTLQDDHQPTCICAYAATPGAARHVVLAGVDGWLRCYNSYNPWDEGPPINDRTHCTITSTVTIGPLRMASPGWEGLFADISAMLDGDSGSVTWELYIGRTAQEAYESTTPAATGTWIGGWNVSTGDRSRGSVAFLKLTSTGQWSLELITIARIIGGRMR